MNDRRVLLVDDDPGELTMIHQALLAACHKEELELDVLTAQNGRHGVAVLTDCLARGQLPHLVLLDLNMPESGGYDFLVALKTHPRFCRLCVVVFTSADHPQEIKKAYAELANGYVNKTFSFSLLNSTMEKIVGFWLVANKVDVLLD